MKSNHNQPVLFQAEGIEEVKIKKVRETKIAKEVFAAQSLEDRIYLMGEMSATEALQRAQTIEKLVSEMKERIVHFVYRKINGKYRKASGTLKREFGAVTRGNGTGNNKTVAYYDLGAGEWRCFRIDTDLTIVK